METYESVSDCLTNYGGIRRSYIEDFLAHMLEEGDSFESACEVFEDADWHNDIEYGFDLVEDLPAYIEDWLIDYDAGDFEADERLVAIARKIIG